MDEHPMPLSVAVNRASKARTMLAEGTTPEWAAYWRSILEESAQIMRRHGMSIDA